MTSPKTQVRGPLSEIDLQFWRNQDESDDLGLGPARTILMLDDALRAALERAEEAEAEIGRLRRALERIAEADSGDGVEEFSIVIRTAKEALSTPRTPLGSAVEGLVEACEQSCITKTLCQIQSPCRLCRARAAFRQARDGGRG